MTREEILTMSAGTGMDALVAKMVMGIDTSCHLSVVWEEGYTEDGKDGWDGFVCPRCKRPQDMLDEQCCKPYSTSIAAAWEVVEHFTGKDCKDNDFFIECWTDGEWFVSFHPAGYSNRDPKAWCDGKKTGHPSAPLAICRAALLSLIEDV